MDASRSAMIYTTDDTSAQQFFYYINIYVRLHVSSIQVVIIRSLIEITGLQKAAHTFWGKKCAQPSVIL